MSLTPEGPLVTHALNFGPSGVKLVHPQKVLNSIFINLYHAMCNYCAFTVLVHKCCWFFKLPLTLPHFSRSQKLLTGPLFACSFDQKNPNCTPQIVCQQKAWILPYILMPHLTCLEQFYYIKNTCKVAEFLKHYSCWHFCYTWQCMDKVK